MSLSHLWVQVLLSVWTEAAEVAALCVEWGSRGHASCCCWMACEGGEELRVLCLLSVLKGCSLCGVRQPRSCQLLLLDGLQKEKSRGVLVSSLGSSAALGVD